MCPMLFISIQLFKVKRVKFTGIRGGIRPPQVATFLGALKKKGRRSPTILYIMTFYNLRLKSASISQSPYKCVLSWLEQNLIKIIYDYPKENGRTKPILESLLSIFTSQNAFSHNFRGLLNLHKFFELASLASFLLNYFPQCGLPFFLFASRFLINQLRPSPKKRNGMVRYYLVLPLNLNQNFKISI